MARRSMKAKIQPSTMTVLLNTPTIPAATGNITPGVRSFYIDLSQCASLLNRRFYRQGLNWAVNSFKVFTFKASSTNPGFSGQVLIEKLPNTWIMSNSWTKGFKHWQEQTKKAAEDAESTVGKFLDFKIYADADHHQLGFGQNLLPLNAGGAATAGEWLPSDVVITSSTTNREYEIIATGGNYPGAGASGKDAVSLINGYENSRSLPYRDNPNIPGDSDDTGFTTPENWLGALDNQGILQDTIVLDNIQEQDQPPYPYENDGTHTDTMYPGGQNQLAGLEFHDKGQITTTSIGSETMIKGGTFPCGLIKITGVNYDTNPQGLQILVDLVPGEHRGYLAEHMLEM